MYSDCVHLDEERRTCVLFGMFDIKCDSNPNKGCCFTIQQREGLLL